MTDTLDFLMPNFQQLGGHGLASAVSDIKDPALRKAVLADARLQDDILANLFAAYDLRTGMQEPLGEALGHLKTLLASPMPEFHLRLGCAGYAETFARVALKDMTAIETLQIPREVIRASLRFRNLSIYDGSATLPSKEELETDGAATLVAWLTTLPKNAAKFVALRLDALPPRLTFTGLDKRKTLCETMLAGMTRSGLAS